MVRGMKSYARPPRAQLFAGRVLTCLIIFDLPKSWCAVQSASSQSELIHFSFSYLFSFLIFLIMPKSNSLLSLWIKDYPELYLDKGSVFCKYCSKIVSCDKKFQITQHLGTSLHKNNSIKYKNLAQRTLNQSFASTSKNEEQESFRFDLCNALVSANIPLAKLDNTMFKTFLGKYTKFLIPDRSTIRNKYVNMVFKETMIKIKDAIGDNNIYIIVDETTDTCGRYIANLLIGILNEDCAGKSYLIGTQELDRTNNVTISKFINDCLTRFYLPNAVPSEKVLLMLSDAAAYMIKSAQNLKIFYNNLIHVTCLAHGVNRIAEEIRNEFPDINRLVNKTKKVFIKAPLRVQYYKDKLPELPLPPQPVITRWGTWLDATLFYAENFEKIKEIVCSFSDDSAVITNCKNILNKAQLPQELAFIKANYGFISELLTKLETQDMELSESIELIQSFKNRINNIKGTIGQRIKTKLEDVLRKNEGFTQLTKISNILQGNHEENIQMSPSIICKFKYAPITSVDVERSFSAYKQILSNRRQSFLIENLEKHLIISIYNSVRN